MRNERLDSGILGRGHARATVRGAMMNKVDRFSLQAHAEEEAGFISIVCVCARVHVCACVNMYAYCTCASSRGRRVEVEERVSKDENADKVGGMSSNRSTYSRDLTFR